MRVHEPVEDEQDHDLADQPDRQQHAGQPDVEVGQHGDEQDHAERQPRPADVDAELGQLEVEEVGEPAGQRGLEHRVGQQRPVAGADADLPAQTVADVGVETARGRLLPGHRDVADREDHQHDGGEQERGGRADPLPEADHDRGVEQHGRDRRRAGQGQEEHAVQPDGALAELMDVLAVGDVEALEQGGRDHSVLSDLIARSWPLLNIRHAASLLSGPGLVPGRDRGARRDGGGRRSRSAVPGSGEKYEGPGTGRSWRARSGRWRIRPRHQGEPEPFWSDHDDPPFAPP